MGHLVRKAMLATVVVAALVGIVSALASAATKTTFTFVAPSPAPGEELSTDAVEFKFTYNKKPNATATLECALAGPTSFPSDDCDDPVASGKKGSQSGKSYSGLANGDYTFTATLTLTDGGTASATRSFTVAGPKNEIQLVRVTGAPSGTFTLTFSGQTTDPLPSNATAAQVQAALFALTSIGGSGGDVSVTGGPVNVADAVIEFTGALAGTNVPQLVATGFGGAGVTVSTSQEGG